MGIYGIIAPVAAQVGRVRIGAIKIVRNQNNQ